MTKRPQPPKTECKCQICSKLVLVNKYKAPTWTICSSCANRARNLGRKHTDETNKKNSELRMGEKNPMFNKHHTDETKTKIGKYVRTEECKEIARQTFKLNANHLHPYEIWLKKFGKEKADQLKKEMYEKMGKTNTGSGNPMFGKPSPQGSGNGWSGWYNGVFFRSLLELSYLKKLFNEDIKFESGELKKHAIKYCGINGTERNYFPDFYLVDSNTYVELKPKNLLNTVENKLKFEAAMKSVEKFIVVTEKDIPRISESEILKLYECGDLIWMDRYEIKFRNKYLENT